MGILLVILLVMLVLVLLGTSHRLLQVEKTLKETQEVLKHQKRFLENLEIAINQP